MKIKKILVGVVVQVGLSLGTSTALAQEIVQYVHTDALGSPVAISDATGAIIERTLYEPYGAVVGDAKGDRPGFTGHVSDLATDLTYMQQRYYDPQIGGFLSVDPVAASSGSVAGFNRYRYANGNPYGFTDPDGRESCTVGTRICMSEKALRAKIDKLNEVSPTQSNASKEAAVQAFASNARPLQAASNREISANMEERHSSDYRVLDYSFSAGDGARNHAPITPYTGNYKLSGILHTHPERQAGPYQLSGAGASGKNGKFMGVGPTHDGDVAASFKKGVNVYAVPPTGSIRWIDLAGWRRAVKNSKPDEVIYAGWFEKDL